MAKQVVWTKSAKRSRRLILEFWNKRTQSKKYSKKISTELNERVDALKEFPELGKSTELEDIRTTACGHFSIFYMVEQRIVILGIYDTRRNPDEIIKELKS